MTQTDPEYDVPCEKACDAYKDLLPLEREYTLMEDAAVDGLYIIVVTEVVTGPMNSGTIVYATEDFEEADEVCDRLNTGDDPVQFMGAMAGRFMELMWGAVQERETTALHVGEASEDRPQVGEEVREEGAQEPLSGGS